MTWAWHPPGAGESFKRNLRRVSREEQSMSKRDVVVLGAARSAIGTFGGALADLEPAELAGAVMKETIKRAGGDPKAVNYATGGNTIPTEGRFAYVARV